MLNTLPYADLLAIHNAIAEKPVRKFDTRANGVRRTAALMEERGLTLPEAALLADVVLPDSGAEHEALPPDEASTSANETDPPHEDSEPDQADEDPWSDLPDQPPMVAIQVEAGIAPQVNAFIGELTKPERPPHLATFLRRLNGGGASLGTATTVKMRERGMSVSQRKIVELCTRPEGATGKELAEGCGWPSIAARATSQKLADRFGYTLEESPKSNGRGISFRMIAKQVEG